MSTQTAELTALYATGRAITQGHAALLESDGIAHGCRVLTADEFAVVSKDAATRSSNPGNNVWD